MPDESKSPCAELELGEYRVPNLACRNAFHPKTDRRSARVGAAMPEDWSFFWRHPWALMLLVPYSASVSPFNVWATINWKSHLKSSTDIGIPWNGRTTGRLYSIQMSPWCHMVETRMLNSRRAWLEFHSSRRFLRSRGLISASIHYFQAPRRGRSW